jgi:hypothetical protein
MSSDVLWEQAERMHKSRLWKTGSPEQAYAVICMGAELGVGPATALSNIQIAMGKPTLGAALVGALVQRSGRYRYTVTELTDQSASIDFFEGPAKIGTSTFTMQDAAKAGLGRSDTWSKYGRNMLLARALTNGVRWFAPGVLGGAIYDPDELGIAGSLAPPEGEDTTGSAPDTTPPSEGAVDAEFTPNGGALVTLEQLLEMFTAEQILAANDGNLPGTDDEVLAVYRKLA